VVVLMVFIMDMSVGVFHRLMLVLMLVVLGESCPVIGSVIL
jgi:hypothetical protein